MLSEISIRRTVAFLGSVGLFVWILVLFFAPGATSGDVPVADATGTTTEEQHDIECSAIASIADGKEAIDWPLDDDGERSASTSSAVAEAGRLCDRFRDARSTHMTLLAAPTVVLGVYALWGSKRREDDTTDEAEPERSDGLGGPTAP